MTTFNAVPEPAAWALMLAGFAGLGAMLRSRRGLAVAVQEQSRRRLPPRA